ncbi:MAG: hypothetical protein QOJ89_3739 [bacterium]|jgi:hypothetical protein
MFGHLPSPDAGPDATEALFTLLDANANALGPPRDNTHIPAGYTYLGQFIDHDITFDPTSLLGRDNDPQALVNFRTPRYDLDSLYGSGPQDQPFLYDWDCEPRGVKLLVGHNPADAEGERSEPVDLPRNERGRALIGDARNDENLIVSQLHLLFIHFHNTVVDCLCDHGDTGSDDSWIFDEARRIVRWHYQWIVVHDFLERLVGAPMAHEVLIPAAVPGDAPATKRRFYSWQDEPFMPVEFSAAAFRCGHSMVRAKYRPKSAVATGFPILPPDGSPGLDFSGFRRLPHALAIDWDRFFDILPNDPPTPSKKIDAFISLPLFKLPPDGRKALPRLNLQRGRALGLPAGRDVAHAMGEEPLTREQLELFDPHVRPCADVLFRATPLWYYIVCEARAVGMAGLPLEPTAGGISLGPVGGRIVAEVLVGLLEGDPQSYLRQWPAWTPALDAKILRFDAADPTTFTMPDLVRFADPPRANAPKS